MDSNTIIIPDIHGRNFWKNAIKEHENNRIVFLGDYMDPYPNENISFEDALDNFYDILDFKKSHMDNVTLLLGNHDINYLHNEHCSRYDRRHCLDISALFMDNIKLFDIISEFTINEKQYILSHAGIIKDWFETYFKDNPITILNQQIKDIDFFSKLWEMSFIRGGYQRFGSPVWADIREYTIDGVEIMGDIQIVGHTQLKYPIKIAYGNGKEIIDIDYHNAVLLDSTGKLKDIEGNDMEIKIISLN